MPQMSFVSIVVYALRVFPAVTRLTVYRRLRGLDFMKNNIFEILGSVFPSAYIFGQLAGSLEVFPENSSI